MIVTLAATLLLFIFLNFVFVNFMGVPFLPVAITGHVVNDTGIVQIFVLGTYNVYIYSPENRSYNFSKWDAYILPLNVSADFALEPMNGWKYSLYDLRHSVYIENDTFFSPNSSITAVRWENLLTVFALSDGGEWYNSSVVFYVDVNNSAPLIGNITEPIFVCEGESLDYRFNVTDIDEEDLVGDISPKNPFYLSLYERNGTFSFFDIVSGVLDKDDVGSYVESVSAVDPWDAIDSRDVDVEVIEINNVPILENIGAQTVYLMGENSSFYFVVNVSDIEDGVTGDGSFEFNLTWSGNENLFSVGLNDGVMNYSPVVGHEGRIYSLQICVEDNALDFVHQNISLCSPRDGDSEIVCDNFSLTVTDQNRAPEILNFSPMSSVFEINGTLNVGYSAGVYDADGTIPDIDWYVDDVLKEHNENVSTDSFVSNFGCEVSGAHSVRIVTSDGLLNDSQSWSVSVNEVACSLPSSGGGGGGGGGESCVENWFCEDWKVCQNVERSFVSEILSLEDYSVAKESCFQNKEEDERFCGFQITSCYDLNNCSRVKPLVARPYEKRFCYFTENPGCFDGVTNCHDGACELLVDCGGPCSACATCSDGKQNQGEEDVDCGGPCPFMCEPEVPFVMISSVLTLIAIILIIIILLVLLKLFLSWKR